MRVDNVYADNRGFLISIFGSYKPPELNLVYLVSKLETRPFQGICLLKIIILMILRYIKGPIDYGLVYNNNSLCLNNYSDVNWVVDKDTRGSTSGLLCLLELLL